MVKCYPLTKLWDKILNFECKETKNKTREYAFKFICVIKMIIKKI